MIRRVGKVKSWQEVVDGLAGRRQEKELDRHGGALHDHTAASLLLGRIGVFALVDLTPHGGSHKVPGVVAVVDQRHRRLRHFHPRTVEVLLQTSVQLCQPPVLEVCHTLLLVLDVSPGSQLKSRHLDWEWTRG